MALAASAALADRRPQPDPSELWRSYPLEQKPSTVAKSPAAGGVQQQNGQRPASSADESSSGPSPALIAVLAVAGAGLLGLAAIAARRRRREPVAPGPVFPGAAPRAAPVAAAPAQRALEPAPRTPPPAARPGNGGRAPSGDKSITCQVRWNPRGRQFYAVSVDGNGIEHMLASSPRLEEAGPAPPDETPEARGAIRRLAKDLRDRGWRPLRARGMDFDARRWYARRFRWPTEEELAETGHSDVGELHEHVSGRSAGRR